MTTAPNIMIRPSRDRKPYRLKCRFRTDPFPSPSWLEVEKVRLAERFVKDMHAQGWENLPRYGFKMRGPLTPMPEPLDIKVPPRLPAKEMMARVARGERFLDKGRDYAKAVPKLAMAEYWEFEISAIFARPEILVEVADPHEEVFR